MARFLSPSAEPRAFVVISSMRSGSTLLVRHLRQVGGAACFGEILRADFPRKEGWPRLVKRLDLPPEAASMHAQRIVEWWELVLERTLARRHWAGSKIFCEHRRGEPIWDRFEAPDHRVFHLWRDSVFDTYVSLQLALTTGEWQAPGEAEDADPAHEEAAAALAPAGGPRVHFDAEAYRRYRDIIRADIAAVRERYGSLPGYIELEYAQLADLPAMSALLSTAFGEDVHIEARLRRQRPEPKISYLDDRAAASPFEGDTLRGGYALDV